MTNHILKNEGKLLQSLFEKLDQLREFNQIFARYVTPTIVAHCKIANLQNNRLIVIVDNGNWATQLRFQLPDLIAKLRCHPSFHNLKAICCKTRPDVSKVLHYRKTTGSRTMKPLSQKTSRLILQSADTIKDKKLQEVLVRIAGKVNTIP